MKTTSELLAGDPSTRENWGALLEVAAREVFELMLGCKLTAAKPAAGESMEITSMVGFAGQICGVMSIRCSRKSGIIMASRMLGIEAAKIGAEMCDACGEVCNMVAGNFQEQDRWTGRWMHALGPHGRDRRGLQSIFSDRFSRGGSPASV